MRPTDVGRRRAAVGVSALLVLSYAWVTAGLRPFTLPALVAVVGGGLAAIVVGGHLPRSGPSTGITGVSGAWAWSVLAGAIGLWELQSFLQHPRSQHPTISSLTNSLLQNHPPRMVALLVWLAGGVWLARR